MTELQSPAREIGDKEDQESLDRQRNGDQQDVQGVVNDHFALEGEDDHQGQQQTGNRDVAPFGQEHILEVGFSPALDHPRAGDDAAGQRDHHEQHHGQDQRIPGDLHPAHAQQEGHDGGEGQQDDQVVGSNLHHGIGGVALCQVTPYEHHRRAGRSTQQDGPGQVAFRQVSRDQGFEHHIEEKPRDAKHGEGLDEPVGHPGHVQSLGVLPDIPDALEVHLEHHGVDHQPDQDGDGDGHIGILKSPQEGRNARQVLPDQHTRGHAQQHPQGQVFFKEANAALFLFHNASDCLVS